MEAEAGQSHTWVRLGPVYGAVAADRIAAIVYHAEARRGRTGGPGGNGAVVDPAWYLVWSHEPHRHFQLSAPPRKPDMTTEQQEECAYVVLAEAGQIIDDQLARDNPDAS